MAEQLNTNPLSSDILEKVNIGLWALEFDEGKEPRMYFDKTMQNLLGVSGIISPEAIYRAWFERVEPTTREAIVDAKRKMTDGEAADVQYLWHHPNGRLVTARCSGIRDTAYTAGVRLEGIYRNITEIAQFDTEKEKQELSLKLISSLSDTYSTLYYVNAETGSYDLITQDTIYGGKNGAKVAHGKNFYEDSRKYIQAVVFNEDASKFAVLTDREKLRETLKEQHSFVFDFRVALGEKPLWYRIKAVKIRNAEGHDDYAIGISRVEEERELQQKLNESLTFSNFLLAAYELVYYVDLSTGAWRIIKCAEGMVEDSLTKIADYRKILKKYVNIAVHPNDREAVSVLLNAEEVKAKLRGRQSFRLMFRMTRKGQEKFSCCEIIRGEDDDHIAVAFLNTTSEHYEQQKLRLGAVPLSSDILNKANIGLWAFELDEGKAPRMYVDDAMLGLIGLTEQVSPEETYHAWYDHIDEGSYSIVADSVEKMIAGEHAEVQYPWHHPDGHILVVRCGGVRNFNYTQGIRIEGTHQNVSEVLHFQEEKIAEQDAFIRYFLEPYDSVYYIGLESLTWQIYKRTDVLRQNYPHEENYLVSLGRYIEKEVHPNDREQASILLQTDKLKKRLAEKLNFNISFRVLSEKRERILQCEVVRGSDENHIVMGFKDITTEEAEKKEIESVTDLAKQQRHIKAFGDMINAALWSMDISENDEISAVYWSDEFRHQFGFENTTDFPNTIKAWTDRLHPEDKEKTVEDFYNGIKSKDTNAFVYDIRYRILRKNGEYCWYHAVGRMERNDDGTRRMYGVISDISADIKLEEQNTILQEQQKQLEVALSMAQSANRAKTTFLNSMSHDIRTPMNAIIGYTGLAASHIDNKGQVQNYLEKISQSSDHLLSLINDVLDMSRIESGKMNLEEKPEYLPDIIHTLRDIVQADIHAKQHDFYIDTVNITHESIVCDKLRLNQVLLNILSNSIKYTANGGTISMRITEETVKSNGYAVYTFCIKDNGMGMSEDFLKTIFEPFSRVKSSTISGIQGTGLGMAITKSIVDMMGGKINIKSTLGKGTETSVSFDFKLQDGIREDPQIPALKSVRALIADDDTNTCLSIYTMLKDIGLRAEWCTSGKEAVVRAGAAYREGDLFRVYIIDWLMPDMNGIETTRRIRKVIGDDTPIVILTAYDWSDIEEEAREAGVTAFVSKPLFPSDLHRVLNECIGVTEKEIAEEEIEADFNGKKILLVEDNEINREIATELLEECGFIMEEAEDGDIAVEKMKNAQTGDYDLVLMDVQMPTIDGYEATRQIRALGTEISRIPIIAMTANAFEEDRKLAIEAGMNDHVAKPINVEILKATLAKYL